MARGSYTDFEFRREVMSASAALTSIGPLRVSVPRELARRRVYFGIIWSGFIDWNADAELTFVDSGSEVVRLRQRWGTSYAAGASSTGWGGVSQSWRTVTSGFPSYSVEAFDPALNPNWGANTASGDAMTVSSIQRPSGAIPNVGYRLTMFPFEFIGPLEEIRFEFKGYTPTTVETTPTMEVFLGCKSTQV